MSSTIAHLNAMVNTTTVEDLWGLHTARMESYGFDRLIYGFTRYMGTDSLGDPEDWLLLSTQTREYMKVFVQDGLYFHAPMLRWALHNKGACSWRWMQDMARINSLTDEQRKVVAFNQSMNVTAGYTISFLSVSERVKGAIALTARPGMTQDEVDAVWEESGEEILLLNNTMHLKLQTLPYMGPRKLTKRQREVLQWIGDGKTIRDVGMLLGLTTATVEKHLRLARKALDVETTAQAVLKAGLYNQMFILDEHAGR